MTFRDYLEMICESSYVYGWKVTDINAAISLADGHTSDGRVRMNCDTVLFSNGVKCACGLISCLLK